MDSYKADIYCVYYPWKFPTLMNAVPEYFVLSLETNVAERPVLRLTHKYVHVLVSWCVCVRVCARCGASLSLFSAMKLLIA